jgi:hypothetical protein
VKGKNQTGSSSDEANFDNELDGDDKTNVENMSETLARHSMKNKGKPIHENIQTQPHLKEKESS